MTGQNSAIYGREALHRLREQQASLAQEGDPEVATLPEPPPEAPYEEPAATFHVWTGERWVPWKKWLATAPLEKQPANGAPASNTGCVVADCGGTRVWLVRDRERWQMYVGSRKASHRRRDFASPQLEHAMQTAEFWYGAPGAGWQAEKECNGKAAQTADLPPQNPTHEEETGQRGDDDLDLDGW